MNQSVEAALDHRSVRLWACTHRSVIWRTSDLRNFPSFGGFHHIACSHPSSPLPSFGSMNRYSCFRRRCRRGGLLGGLVVCLVLAGIVGAVGYKVFFSDNARVSQDDLITQVVTRGPFDHIVLEQGEIESSSNTEVICEVKSRGGGGVAILWVIDEGAKVEEGDKLVELDSSQLELELKEQNIKVITAESRATSAAAAVKQAEISREEYLEGVYKSEQKRLLALIAVAEQAKRKAELAIDSSTRLVAKGLIKSLQLEADQFGLVNATNQLEAEQGNLWVLENLTKEKMLVQFDSDIEAAKAALSAAESELMEERSELAELKEQIENCVMFAPAAGVVVHANRYSSRGGSAEFVVEAGATVRERQAIIRLPDPSLMQVKLKVNESRITLIREGMPAKISIDAIPGMKLTGRVKKVNRYAEPSSFFSSSIKEYATLIEIIDPPDNIRTGMTAEVQIFVEQLDNALQIPIQGLYEHGDEMYTLIQRGPDSFETAAVKIVATNDTMASISEGLAENDRVVLNLRDHLSLVDLPEIEREDNSEMRKLAKEGLAEGGPAVALDGAEGGPGAAERRPGGGRPGGGGRAGGGRERGGQFGGGGGRPDGGGGGGRAGGGRPDPSTMVANMMERMDTNKDGKISADELGSMDEQRRGFISAADADGDGDISRAELLQGMQQRFSEGGPRQ